MSTIPFHSSILREYDIRGVVGETLFEKDAYWIGRCFGHIVREKSGKAVVVGRDGRLSSPILEQALVEGLCEAGVDVYRLGLGPTPLLYFGEYELPVDGAIMVTGSHNPPSHNGFKMSLTRKPFFGKDIQAFSQLHMDSLSKGAGKIHETNLLVPYLHRLLNNLEFPKRLTIAWDPGNGATCNVIKELIKLLPGQHFLLNGEIDGSFPAHPPDPSEPENLSQLKQTVLEKQCDLGIAFDGDGDRLAAVDGKGNIFWGDQLLLLFAMDLLTRQSRATIIADVKSSQGLFDGIQSKGGEAIMWKTGHSHIKAKMADSGAMLAGEVSGHFFFKENYYGFDDGIYAGLRLIHLLSQSSQNLADFYESLPILITTPEIRIPCDPSRKFKVPHEIKAYLQTEGCSFVDIDGVRVQLEEGWWLLRASNTQDVLVVRCESGTQEGLKVIKDHLKAKLETLGIYHEVL